MWLYHTAIRPEDVDGMANSVDADQTTLFAKICLFKNLESFRYESFESEDCRTRNELPHNKTNKMACAPSKD